MIPMQSPPNVSLYDPLSGDSDAEHTVHEFLRVSEVLPLRRVSRSWHARISWALRHFPWDAKYHGRCDPDAHVWLKSLAEARVNLRSLDLGCPEFELQALAMTSAEGPVGAVEMLLTHTDVDVNEPYALGPRKAAEAPLSRAVARGHLDIVGYLLTAHERGRRGVQVDVNIVTGVERRTPLHVAALRRHVGAVRLLAAVVGIDANAADRCGLTPLHYAVLHGGVELVRSVLRVPGVHAGAVSTDGRTPLHYAASRGSVGMAQCLVEFGMSGAKHHGKIDVKAANQRDTIDVKTAEHRGTIDVSAAEHRGTIVEFGMSGGVGTEDVNAVEHRGMVNVNAADHRNMIDVKFAEHRGTIDVNAVDYRDMIDVKNTEHRGAIDVNAADHSGAIDVNAAEHCSTIDMKALRSRVGLEIAKRLLEQRGTIAVPTTEHHRGVININARSNRGKTPLHFAARYGRLEFVNWLLEQRGVLTSTESNDGLTPFHVAASYGRTKVLKRLLELPGVDPNAVDDRGGTPLHKACYSGQLGVVRYLMSLSRIDDSSDSKSEDSIVGGNYVGASRSNVDTSRSLAISHRINLNAVNSEGWTPLHVTTEEAARAVSSSSIQNYLGILKLLTNAPGIDMNATDNRGFTPLHFAAVRSKSSPKIAKCLVASRGINLNSVDKRGRAPLRLAVESRNIGIIKLLAAASSRGIIKHLSASSHGINLNLTANDGRTALHYAVNPNTCPPHKPRRYERLAVVEVLANAAGIDLRAKSKFGLTPMEVASQNGRCDLVDYLLQVDRSYNADRRRQILEITRLAARSPENPFLDLYGGWGADRRTW